jgi:hypothetical protein
MSLEDYRIPLDVAHKILATFGITKPTKAYERWVKEDGFDLKDFDAVLHSSPYQFIIDWKLCLEDELSDIAKTLKLLDVDLQFKVNDNEETGYVSCNGKQAAVSYPPKSAQWERFIDPIQSVIPDNIQFRASPDNSGCDTGVFAVLPNDEWEELERISPEFLRYFLALLPTTSRANIRRLSHDVATRLTPLDRLTMIGVVSRPTAFLD